MNIDAMKELLAAVEADDLQSDIWRDIWRHDRSLAMHEAHYAKQAHKGDMNAALALHGALLPGWGYAFTSDSAVTGKPLAIVYGGGRSHEAEATTPARALLIATLRGKIAEMEATDA